MPRLHLFFPENDLALALGRANYTPPPAASRLRISGATLPLWFGDDGDCFVADGVNAAWLSGIRARFGMNINPYTQWSPGLVPSPWGWSLASRRALMRRGVPADVLPSDTALDAMRSLSHRSTASRISRLLTDRLPFAIAPAAEEIRNADEAQNFLQRYGQAVFKLPWSSSGRGLIVLGRDEFSARRQAIEGALSRQGMLLAEPRMAKKLDFALLFTMADGKCRYDGISVFNTVQFGSYSGNILAPQPDLFAMAAEACAPGQPEAVVSALPAVLEEIIGSSYSGPLGVDMMAVHGDGYSLAPAVELNLRMTMGHVCLRFYDRYVASGHHGRFAIVPADASVVDSAVVRDARLMSGTLVLSQPGSPFAFTCTLQ